MEPSLDIRAAATVLLSNLFSRSGADHHLLLEKNADFLILQH